MARILGIGIATLDIINRVDGYPPEDSEVRALAQRVSRGGNCTNTLVVLSQLGHHCSWGGVLVDEPDASRIVTDLDAHAIDLTPVRRLPKGKVPTSYITLNQRNGSRSIVHYRDLPEYDFDAFATIELGACDWLHFEGRNIDETEKPRAEIERLFADATLLLFSRAYVHARGGDEPAAFLRDMRLLAPHTDLVLAWGEAGAFALGRDGGLVQSPAFPPPRVVDTLGAGDTFNAGIIDARLHGATPADALTSACRLAGTKCGIEGLNFSRHSA